MTQFKVEPVAIPANAPYRNPPLTQELAWALKGLAQGKANEGQQTLAVQWIVNELARYYDLSYRANERDTAFAEGKRFCGAQLVRVFNLTPEQITKLPKLAPASSGGDDELPNI
ncbi:MAG: hypothetical protein JO107_14175 [Hyphomicrobiales bacterium]|nr:hypothetical protein [Hyphomicrobiales bacterium]MBV8664236.1 hypothetical protein [Hyphomicrobiales bacterium]